MQGTIKEFDGEAGTGSVVTDDRDEFAIDVRSMDGIILTLRPGQRVVFDAADDDGRKVARGLRLVTFER
ncbi:MAG TPA: cold shock domain-containing protein [Actinomycetota bacterium]|nr:cold shock domain-containing protein [Actinomycetota bacterium]